MLLLANLTVTSEGLIRIMIYDNENVKEIKPPNFDKAISFLIANGFIIKTEIINADGSRSLWFEGRSFGELPY